MVKMACDLLLVSFIFVEAVVLSRQICSWAKSRKGTNSDKTTLNECWCFIERSILKQVRCSPDGVAFVHQLFDIVIVRHQVLGQVCNTPKLSAPKHRTW